MKKNHMLSICATAIILVTTSSVVFAKPKPSEQQSAKVETDTELLKKGQWRDPMTDLIWSRCSLGQPWSGFSCTGNYQVYRFSEATNAADSSDLGGHNDWRLPTVEELRTLMAGQDIEGYSSPVNAIFKPHIKDFGVYWSSSPDNGEYMACVNFRTGMGQYYCNLKEASFVRLVRTNQ